MILNHDFVKYPELTNKQLGEFETLSPHEQIKEDFQAEVVEVQDGDTITVRTNFRDFAFPVRFLEINAPEMSQGGQEAREWLRSRILGQRVEIQIDEFNRVGKYGRLLGRVIFQGFDMGLEMLYLGLVMPYGMSDPLGLPNLKEQFNIKKWLPA